MHTLYQHFVNHAKALATLASILYSLQVTLQAMYLFGISTVTYMDYIASGR